MGRNRWIRISAEPPVALKIMEPPFATDVTCCRQALFPLRQRKWAHHATISSQSYLIWPPLLFRHDLSRWEVKISGTIVLAKGNYNDGDDRSEVIGTADAGVRGSERLARRTIDPPVQLRRQQRRRSIGYRSCFLSAPTVND